MYVQWLVPNDIGQWWKWEHVYFAEMFVFVHYDRLFFWHRTVTKRFIVKQKADKGYSWLPAPLNERLPYPREIYDPRNRPPIDDGNEEKWMPKNAPTPNPSP